MHPLVPQLSAVFCTIFVWADASGDNVEGVIGIVADARSDSAPIERVSAAAVTSMNLCIRFSVPVAVDFQ